MSFAVSATRHGPAMAFEHLGERPDHDPTTGARLARVDHQVDDDLLQLVLVAHYQGEARIQRELQPLFAEHPLRLQKIRDRSNRCVQISGACPGTGTVQAWPGIIHETLHDPLDPLDSLVHITSYLGIGTAALEYFDVTP